MSPNLYDLLDVDESASADEVRTAWKSAIADLDPTDRRFRAYNDAAGVLLDADKRAAYDAQLAEQRAAESDTTDEPGETDEPGKKDEPDQAGGTQERAEEPVPAPAAEQPDTGVAAAEAAPVTLDKARDQDAAPEAEVTEPGETAEAGTSKRLAHGPGPVPLVAAAIAAILAVVLAAWVLSLPDVRPRGERAEQVTAVDNQVEQLVADKVVPLLSYDYRTMPQDLHALQQYMTPAMAARQAKTSKALTKQAQQQKAVIEAQTPRDAPGTGLTRVSADGTRAVVVAYIDQHVRKLATAPFVLNMWATFVLEKDAKTGSWLVDDICTDRTCG